MGRQNENGAGSDTANVLRRLRGRALAALRRIVPAGSPCSARAALIALAAVFAFAATSRPVLAQEMNGMNSDVGSELGGPAAVPPSSASNPNLPAPIPHITIRQPVAGTMMVSPPYGNAPLTVGFFVLATDPENIGFLTYAWNFGDGAVSSLPPELYIFHTYSRPGTYVCSLQLKTIDGRSKTLMQGVVVRPPSN